MAQGNHTPGPLFIGSEHDEQPDGSVTYKDNDLTGWPYYVHTGPRGIGYPPMHTATGIQDLDDARLYAAAPDLLNALELAQVTIRRLDARAKAPSAMGTLDVIAAAIAKATGKEG